MPLQLDLRSAIHEEALKLIKRHHEYHNNLHAEHARSMKRMSGIPPKEVRVPEYWSIDRKFNPFYVRPRAEAISRSIARKIEAGTYVPNDPHEKQIPKAAGGLRDLTIFQIPDAAVSNYYYRRLLAKNSHR